MSEKTKMVGIGAILSPMLIAMLVGTVTIVGSWASKVPELQTTVKLEFKHVNNSVDKLTNAQTTTNIALEKHAENDSAMIKVITETLLGHDFMIKQILKDQQKGK